MEVHQQLDTGKLFSRAPGVLRDEKPDFVVKRRLRPVASELGEFDAAALEAHQKGLEFSYECYRDTISLVELDCEPPQSMNAQALDTALTIGLLVGADFVDQSCVMRKTVIDGSNTSGFQRTALVCVGGKLDIGSKTIRLSAMALEEDAARPTEKTSSAIVYRLDRLGIPLIELSTEPDISSPEEAKAAALAIGTLFRRTCRAKRGLGTIRQDLNISVPGGARVEIKGVQELELMDEFVRREMLRQEKLIMIRGDLAKKHLEPGDFSKPPVDLSGIFSKTGCKFLIGKPVFGVCVPKFLGFLGRELQPNRRLGTEVANYVKTRTGLKGVLHSDELPAYGVSDEEVSRVRHALSCQASDAFILVSAEKPRAQLALREAVARCQACLTGVLPETRQALEDGNTEYLRPLPGAARMYPETDLAPVQISAAHLLELKKHLPLSPEERVALYTSKGLSLQLAEKMKLDNWAIFFEELLSKGMNPTFVATVLLETLVELKRDGIFSEKISGDKLVSFFELEKKGKILRENAKTILAEWAKHPRVSISELLKTVSKSDVSESELVRVCQALVQKNAPMVSSRGLGALGPLMGDAMKELRGHVSGERISAALKKAIEDELNKAKE